MSETVLQSQCLTLRNDFCKKNFIWHGTKIDIDPDPESDPEFSAKSDLDPELPMKSDPDPKKILSDPTRGLTLAAFDVSVMIV